MSLNIYFNKEEIPAGMKYVRCNDDYFDEYTYLQDTELCRKILKEIDNAEYVSKNTFLGVYKDCGALYREYLSTGGKTILNIMSHTDVCFDILECGGNALGCLGFLNSGNVFYSIPVSPDIIEEKCDFVCGGKHYDNIISLCELVRRHWNGIEH